MDSYGIHATQMENETAANHVININQQRQAYNKDQLSNYQDRLGKVKEAGATTKEEGEGSEVKDVAMGIPEALSAYKMTKKYGGIGHALTEGTRDNLYHYGLPGGRAFAGKMGPAERAVRGVADPSLDKALTGPLKSVAGGVSSVAGGISSAAGGVSQAIKTSGILGQKTADRALFEASAPSGIVAPPTAPSITPVTDDPGKIGAAQMEDVKAGYHGTGGAELTDPTKNIEELAKGVAPEIGKAEHSLSIPGSIVKTGLTALGRDAKTAQLAGAATDVGIGGISSIYTGVKDFGMGGWKKEGTMSKVGDVTGMVGGALDAAAVAVPVLAPLAGLFDVVGAALDIGGEKASEQKQESQVAPPKQKQMLQVSASTYQTASASGPSAITKQKMQGGGAY
jgi:hypothetical protein